MYCEFTLPYFRCLHFFYPKSHAHFFCLHMPVVMHVHKQLQAGWLAVIITCLQQFVNDKIKWVSK
jgi:hypothetical protein